MRLPFEVLVYCVSYRVVTVGWSCAAADWVVPECLCEPPAENSCCADWRYICSFVSSGTFLMILGIVVVIMCVYVCMHHVHTWRLTQFKDHLGKTIISQSQEFLYSITLLLSNVGIM